MNNNVLGRLSKIVSIIAATLLCILIPGNSVALANANMINNALNVDTFRIENSDPSETQNSQYFKFDFTDVSSLSDYTKELCRQVEAEGAVMLTNNGALPLDPSSKVSLFAQGSVALNYATSGSSSSDSSKYDNFKTALESNGFDVNDDLWNHYLNNNYRRTDVINGLFKKYTVNEEPWSSVNTSCQGTFAEFGDAAIVTLSRNSGEGFDVNVKQSDGEDGSYLSITNEEKDLLEQLTVLKKEGTFKNIIVLLNSATPIEVDFLFRESIEIDACLWIGNLGMSGIYGVVDILSGKVNPSGRLTDTYCRDNVSSPAMASMYENDTNLFSQIYPNAKDNGLNSTQMYYCAYVEGIYVGYRYYETRYEDFVTGRAKTGDYHYENDVAFPFGHGESYTTFERSDFSLTENTNDTYTVSLKVTNTGNVSGKDVVQIYVQKPYDDNEKFEVAAVELVGYAKTKLLAADESQTVSITMSKELFKSYDAYGAGTYVLSKGDYYLAYGTNAHDAVNNILAAKGFTPENTSNRMSYAGNSNFAKLALHLDSKDSVTYSKSVETGKPINNMLDFADMNRYENRGANSVTYVTRSDWEGSFPSDNVEFVLNNAMINDLGSHKPIVEDGSASPQYAVNQGLMLIMMRGLDYDDVKWETYLNQMTYEEQALLITNASFGTTALKSIGLPETKANDGPTGVKSSNTKTSFPSEGIWASTFDIELIEKIGDALAEDAALNGLSTMYAPGVNIHRTPFGGRAHEYFSEDPMVTAYSAIAEIKGMEKKGVVGTLKHYAFNDFESARNGISVWINEQSAREIYLTPFEYAMRPSIGGASAAMSSFNRAGTVWTGASKALQLDICRNEWDYCGYFITDMAAANGALYMTLDDGVLYGSDLFLGSGSKTALAQWRDSNVYRNRVRDAAHRVLYVTVNKCNAMNGIVSTSKFVILTPWWQTLLVSLIVVCSVLTTAGLCYWIYTCFATKKNGD